MTKKLTLPDNVAVFSFRISEVHKINELGVALYGQKPSPRVPAFATMVGPANTTSNEGCTRSKFPPGQCLKLKDAS